MKIIDPGTGTALRGFGRCRWSEGLPEGGAADRDALRNANLLVGNAEGEIAIEMTLRGITVLFEEDAVIALTGADRNPRLNGERIPNYCALPVHQNDYLCLSDAGDIVRGQVSYLAVHGGFLSDSENNGDGEDRELHSGDHLKLKKSLSILPNMEKRRMLPPFYEEEITLRVIPGPQVDHFTDEALRIFYNSSYTVAGEPDRKAIRLQGRGLDAVGYEVSPRVTIPGAVQVGTDGQPILSFVDAPTVGTLIRIASVATADLPLVGQLSAGMIVRFRPITVEQAQGLLRRRHKAYLKRNNDVNALPKDKISLSQRAVDYLLKNRKK
ncbi:MAG: biotin-dependent carboxyltransferase family protein [Eubacteriales bacterium]